MPDNEVVIKVTSHNDVRPGFEAAKREAESAGSKSSEAYQEKFRDKLKEMGIKVKEPMDRVGKDIGEGLGGKVSDEFMTKMRKAFSDLPEVAKSNDAHVKVHVDADLDKDMFGSRLKSMFQKVIPDSLNGAFAGLQGGDFKTAALTGLVVALAPLISGAIADAVALAVGGGVLAGGIALAANDPKVRGAFGDLKDHLMDKSLKPLEDNVTKAKAKLLKAETLHTKGIDSAKYDLDLAEKALAKAREFNRLNESLRDMASVFVAPLTRSAKTLADGVDRLKPDIKELFNTMAPVLDKLTPGLVGLFEKMMPGVKKIVEASVPLFETLSEYLPVIGDALGDFFTKIADHGDEANTFFADLLDAVVTLIDYLGSMVTAFLHAYDTARYATLVFASLLTGYFGKILHGAVLAFGWIPGIGPKLKSAEKQFSNFQRSVNEQLAGIHDRDVKIHVSAIGVAAAKAAIRGAAIIAGRAHGGVTGAASGGARSGQVWVGEQGPELVSLPFGSTVHTAGDSRRMAQGGQGAPVVIQMIPGVDQGLIREIMRLLRFEIGNQGGNVQTVLGRA